MSLTDFLEIADVREKFKLEFPKPRFNLRQEILASPPSGGSSRLVGTAYDYLLRFYIKYLNPQAQDRGWVATNALNYYQRNQRHDLLEQATVLFERAEQNYQQFLTDGQFTDDLLISSLFLAKLDAVYRIRYIYEDLQTNNDIDIQDLRNLVGLLKPEIFKSSGKIVLNPVWGAASMIVRGADGDLIIDDLLVDFKTVKNLSLELRDFRQLMGYYTLSVIAQDFEQDVIELKRLGIYFSRFGLLYQFKVADVVNPETFPKFVEWFISRAENYSGIPLM